MAFALTSLPLESKEIPDHHSHSTFPINPSIGQFHYETSNHSLYRYDGKEWTKRLFEHTLSQTFSEPVIIAGGTEEDIANDVATDQEGNIYILGTFRGEATFGTETIEAGTVIDSFIWKINKQGVHQWVMSPTASDFGNVVQARTITIDHDGNIIVAGNFSRRITFGSTTLSLIHSPNGTGGVNDNDIFIWKLNVDGEHVWAKSIGSSSFDFVTDIEVDSNGNGYIVGSFWGGNLVLGNSNLEKASDEDAFIWKFDSSGEHIWAAGGGGVSEESLGSDFANAIAIDETNSSIYITGRCNTKRAVFGGIDVNFPTIGTAYIWKLDIDGNHQWIVGHEAVDMGMSSGQAITHDKEGNIYNTGFIMGDQIIGTEEVSTEGFINSVLYVWKLSSDGEHRWVKTGGGIQSNSPNEILLDSHGDIYVSGSFTSSIDDGRSFFGGHEFNKASASFVWKINDQGEHIWVELARGNRTRTTGMVIDQNDNIYLSGYLEFLSSFGEFRYDPPTPGNRDIFVWNLANVFHSQPELEFSSQNLDFGVVENGTSKELSVTIANNGTAALEIESIEIISEQDQDQFSFASSEDLILTEENQELTIDFTPTTWGDKSAILRIHSRDSESRYDINLAGEGANVTSIDQDRKPRVGLYPNPARSELHIVFDNPSKAPDQIILTNMNGKEVSTFDGSDLKVINNEYHLSISNLLSGTYLVYGVTDGVKTLIDRLIVQ